MKIQLLADYRGILSDERYFTAGEYEAPDQMPEHIAEALVDAGRATVLEAEPPASKPRTTRTKRQTK